MSIARRGKVIRREVTARHGKGGDRSPPCRFGQSLRTVTGTAGTGRRGRDSCWYADCRTGSGPGTIQHAGVTCAADRTDPVAAADDNSPAAAGACSNPVAVAGDSSPAAAVAACPSLAVVAVADGPNPEAVVGDPSPAAVRRDPSSC